MEGVKLIMENTGNVKRVLYRQPLDISTEKWAELLNDSTIFTEKDIDLIHALYHRKDSKEKASVLAKLLGEKSHSVLNLQVGRLSKRIINKNPNINYPKRERGIIRYWHIPFWGEDAEMRGHYYWQLRPELKEAFKQHFIESSDDEFVMPQELSNKEIESLVEGAKKQITVNVYERNTRARQLCIEKYGYQCCVCDFNFEEYYGEVGKGFIEVHHLIPLSEVRKEYEVDPVNDLRPLCSNCHVMIHRGNFSIEELRNRIRKNK